MKILVTGATGFIGSHLLRGLTKEGHQVTALVRHADELALFSDSDVAAFVVPKAVLELITLIEREAFDGVIHLASLFLAQHKPEDIEELVGSNILFATSVLEAAVQAKVKWFINTGTFWQHFESKSYSPVNLYAATKEAFQVMAQFYIETTPINFVTLKLCDTFGPGDTRPKVMNLLQKSALSGESLDMSPGEQQLDISYIDNVIDAYVHLIELFTSKGADALSGRSFALRSDQRLTLKELVALFEEVTGSKVAINWGKREYRQREVMVPWENGELVPGLKPAVSLREGIKRTFGES